MGMPEILALQMATMKAVNGIAVTYYRSEQFVNLTVIPGRTLANMTDLEGLSMKICVSDFLILRTDLVIDGEETLPLKGDRIVTTNGSVYEVLPYGGEPEYRESDPYGIRLRVHVKLIETNAYLLLDDGSALELDDGTFLVLE